MSFSNAASTYAPHVAPGPVTAQTGAQDGGVLQPRISKEKNPPIWICQKDLTRLSFFSMQFRLTHRGEDVIWSEHNSPPAAKALSGVVHNSLQQLEAEALWDVAKLTYLKWSLSTKAQQNSSKTEIAQLSFKPLLPFDSNQVCWVHCYRKTSND